MLFQSDFCIGQFLWNMWPAHCTCKHAIKLWLLVGKKTYFGHVLKSFLPSSPNYVPFIFSLLDDFAHTQNLWSFSPQLWPKLPVISTYNRKTPFIECIIDYSHRNLRYTWPYLQHFPSLCRPAGAAPCLLQSVGRVGGDAMQSKPAKGGWEMREGRWLVY